MRILVLSNFYPPYYVGGYELACRKVVDELRARGHDVGVLTSTYGIWRRESEGQVHRWLTADLGREGYNRLKRSAFHLFRRELVSRSALSRLLAGFEPDVVYAWNMAHISLSLALMAQERGLKVCYYVSDNWLAHWETYEGWLGWWATPPRRRIQRWGKRLLRFLAHRVGLGTSAETLDLKYAQFASHYLKKTALRAGKAAAGAQVIHHGVDVERFSPRVGPPRHVKRLLYVGQLVPHKGVYTAIEALKILSHDYGHRDLGLTIVGGTIIPDYEAELRRQVSAVGLDNQIRFTGLLPPEGLPEIYQQHDVLIFPSVWDEPFSITLLEAMSSGLAVVGTANGGSAEILEDRVNALIFPREDAAACAAHIHELMGDVQLFDSIRLAGRRTVERQFRFEQTVESIEQALLEAAGGTDRA